MNPAAQAGMMIILAATVLVAASFFFGSIALSIVALRRWRGLSRIAAGLPLLALLSLALIILIGVVKDPTAHNLWPFELILWGFASLVYLGALTLVRRFTKSTGTPG